MWFSARESLLGTFDGIAVSCWERLFTIRHDGTLMPLHIYCARNSPQDFTMQNQPHSSGLQSSCRPTGKRRRRMPSSMAQIWTFQERWSCSHVLILVFGLMYNFISPVHSSYDYCEAVATAASGGETLLSPEQFAYMVRNISDGMLDFFTDPSSVPADVTQSYAVRSDPTDGLDMSIQNNTLALCSDLYAALLRYWGESVDFQTCRDSISFGQGNNPRITTDEFARFVYSISDGEYGTEEKGTPPDSLPGQLYAIFLAYGILDFEGVGEDYYIGACAETMVAVKVASRAPPVEGEQTPAPTTGDEATSSPTINSTISDEFFTSCKTALVIGDSIERDDTLSAEEYVRFLSRLLPDEISMSESYVRLPHIFQANFETLAGDQSFIDVAGSKPNVEPTSDQLAHLKHVCASTESAIATYHDGFGGGTPAPTSSTDDGTDNGNGDDWNMTAAEFMSCRISLMYSDVSRDDKLDSDEYLRFINRVLNTTTTTFQASSELSPVFQSSFTNLSQSTGFIDVAGSKPVPMPTDAQLLHLKQVCKATAMAVSVYLSEHDEPFTNSTSAPTPDAFFVECTAALSVADRDYNGVMSDDEYVRFINKLQGSTYTSLSSLSSSLQTNFENICKGGNSVDIAGASGSPTSSQLEQLTFVCSETQATIEGQDDSNNGMSEERFRLCQKALSSSDRNNDGWLEPVEYIDLLNLLLNNEFKGASFSKINEMFRVSYEKSKGANEFIDVAGASLGESATKEQTSNLRGVCLELTSQIALYEKPTKDELSACLLALQPLVASDSYSISSNEYLGLVKSLTGPKMENVAYLEGLPFVVRDNYDWIKWGGEALDLSSLKDSSTANTTEILRWSCEKTIIACDLALDVFAESSGTSVDFCTIPLSFSDLNADNNLDQHEFHLFVDHLSGKAWANEDYNALDSAIQEVFNAYVDSTTGLIQVHGSKPNDSPSDSELDYLKTFCAKTEDAVATARENSLFFQSCVRVLSASDSNGDASLSADEYAKFVSIMAAWDGEVSFLDLDSALQKNFENLKDAASDQEVDIQGAGTEQNLTASQEQHLRSVCQGAKDTLWDLEPPTIPPFTRSDDSIRVNNTFIVSNVKGLVAKDLLDGLNRAGLNEAYGVFVNEFVVGPLALRLRGRRLGAVALLPESAEIYRMEDFECPRAVVEGSSCLLAYAAFYLDKAPSTSFQQLSQRAISEGNLQAVLSRIDSQNDLVVVGAYSATTNEGEDSTSDGTGSSLSLGVMIGIAAGASCAIFAFALFLYYHFQKGTRFRCAKQTEKGKPPPECSPYATDYDHALQPRINHIVAGPRDLEFGEGSASEQFEDEPGQYSNISNDGYKGTKVERFDDEPVAAYSDPIAAAVGAADIGYCEAAELDRFEDEPGSIQSAVESQKAPVYVDNSYGELQEDEPTSDSLFSEDHGMSVFSEREAKSKALEANVDDEDFGFFASAKADHQTENGPSDENNGGWGGSPMQWATDESPPDTASTSGSSYAGEANIVGVMSPGDFPKHGSTGDSSFARGVEPEVYKDCDQENKSSDGDEEQEDDEDGSDEEEEDDEAEHKMELDVFSEDELEESDGEEGESDDDSDSYEDERSETSGSESESEGSRESEAETIDDSVRNTSSQPYYKEIKALVAQVVPDELENVDAMMEQFAGKEEELLQTLQNMAGLGSEDGSSDESEDDRGSEGGDSQAISDDESDDVEDESEDESDADSDVDGEQSEVEDGDSSHEDDEQDVPSDEGSGSEDVVSDEESRDADASQTEGSGDDEEVTDTSTSDCEEDGSGEDAGESEEEGDEEEESYYSEEVVESSETEESDQSGSGGESSYEEESYHSEDEEETIDDEEETIDDEGDDGSSSCSDSD